MAVFTHDIDVWDRLCIVGRAPCTKETLPNFHELVSGNPTSTTIPWVDGLSTDPREWGVIAWYQSLGIRLPRAWGTWA